MSDNQHEQLGAASAEFARRTLLHIAAISEAALPYEPGVARAGSLRDIADAKHFALTSEGLPYAMPFDETERVLDEIVKRVDEGQVPPPRWEMVAQTEQTVKGVVEAHAGTVLGLASEIGMIRSGETEYYSEIDPFKALFVVEGGANKTSVIRRAVAERAMHEMLGAELGNDILYQFGSNREIVPLFQNKDGDKPNPEHRIIRSIASSLPEDASFTEFEANLATAIADGYFIDSSPGEQSVRNPNISTTFLRHNNPTRPTLCLVQPEERGLAGGLEALAQLTNLAFRQIVVSSNGQYRPKNKVLLEQFSDKHKNLHLMPGVALGDEQGDSAPYLPLGALVTPERPLSAYVNEFPIYYRAATKWLAPATKPPMPQDTILRETQRADGSTIRLTPQSVQLILASV